MRSSPTSHPPRAAVLIALALCALPFPLPAQRTSDAETAARAMLAGRARTTDAARALMADHRQSAEQTVAVLSRVGFPPSEVAEAAVTWMRLDVATAVRALQSTGARAGEVATGLSRGRVAAATVVDALSAATYPAREVAAAALSTLTLEPLALVETLKRRGYPPADVRGALQDAGGLVDLGCIDPQGFPAPCGNPGGDAATAMGVVTLIPESEGWTDSILTLESTNIPPVQVLLSGQVLPKLEQSPNRVRVRLPSSSITGPLVLRRNSDGVEGLLHSAYAVKEPPPPPPNWGAMGAVALSEAVEEAQQWILGAEILGDRCIVNGALAVGLAGVLASSTGFQGRIRSGLEAAGAPPQLAAAWDEVFQAAWGVWASNVTIPALPWYPVFAAYPADPAPPMPNVPTPVGTLLSQGTGAMTAPLLAAQLRTALGPEAETTEALAAIDLFSTAMGVRFAAWLAKAQVMMVLGQGPVPGHAGTVLIGGAWMPGGPVENGSCSGTGVLAGSVF